MSSSGVFVFALLITTVAALALSAHLVRSAAPDVLTPGRHVQATVVPVVVAKRRDDVGVGVKVSYRDGLPVTTDANGRVTRVRVRTGEVVGEGKLVADVDDAAVVGMISPSPLFRDLGPGARGTDVSRLQSFLRRLHLMEKHSGQVGVFDGPTIIAVEAFNDRYGRSEARSTFHVSSIAWLGSHPIEAGAVAVRIGDRIAPGSTLFTGARTPQAILVSEPTGGIPSPGSRHLLVVGDVRVPYAAGSGKVKAPAAVRQIRSVVGTSGTGAGEVISARAADVLTVPATAVVTDSAGRTCVFPTVAGGAVKVTAMGSGAGTVDLPAAVGIKTVLVSPLQVLQDPSCG